MSQAFKVGDRVFLNEDARLWMKDIGVRPGKVIAIDGAWPIVEFWGMDERIWVNPNNLEVSDVGSENGESRANRAEPAGAKPTRGSIGED